MAETILVAGTASHVGKSTVAAGLCRLLARRGVDVAPFKAQNMSNNARAVPVAPGADGDGFGEIGVSQAVQARAAGVEPTTDHNPVLLKPRGDGESQLVIDGVAVGHYAAETYYADHWEHARSAAVAAHERLAERHDVVVAEGAGSIAEVNLHDRDLANLETARFADARVLLVADIDRGGAFASIVGTLSLLPADVRDRVAGVVITKFRGDRSLLEPGIETVASRTGVPVLGVLPHEDPGLPAEDSLSLPAVGERAVWGDDDGVPASEAAAVVAIRLPRVSNVTDLEPLAAEPGVRVAVRPPDASLEDADAVVVPGTKNAVDDLLACREAGLDERLREFDGPVLGLCGGYQLLGERLTNASVEGTGDRSTVEGLHLLPVETAFAPAKRVERVSVPLHGVGPLAGVDASVEGYEIHAGRTEATGPLTDPFDDADRHRAGLGAARGRVFGTYLHGLFENRPVRRALRRTLGLDPTPAAVGASADRAADLLAEWVDLEALGGDRGAVPWGRPDPGP